VIYAFVLIIAILNHNHNKTTPQSWPPSSKKLVIEHKKQQLNFNKPLTIIQAASAAAVLAVQVEMMAVVDQVFKKGE
jgi:RecB family endonuclease NucS